MIKVSWQDSGREPTQKPNPQFPDGVDINLSNDGKWHCKVDLPYPAKRIGHYLIECDICGMKTIVTTAGRPDDPRSVRVPCERKEDA